MFPNKNQIKNIIFDFGGVLFNIDYDAPIRAFEKLGIDNFREIYSKAIQSTLFDDLECGKISENDFVESLQKYFPKPVGHEAIIEAWNSILIGIRQEAVDMLQGLSKNYSLFILSNTNSMHIKAFEQMIDDEVGLDDFKSKFEKVYYSSEMGMRKPHPEIFKKVCENHALNPDETLFIDDSAQHVEGAAAAGLKAYYLDLSKENIEDLLEKW